MKTTEFNKQNLNVLAADIQEALNAVAKKHGLDSIKLSTGGSYTGTSFTTKLEARTIAKAADPTFLRIQESLLRQLDLPGDSIGRKFTSLGQTFEIDRIDSKKWKKPVIAYLVVGGNKTEKGYKFGADQVRRALQTQGA